MSTYWCFYILYVFSWRFMVVCQHVYGSVLFWARIPNSHRNLIKIIETMKTVFWQKVYMSHLSSTSSLKYAIFLSYWMDLTFCLHFSQCLFHNMNNSYYLNLKLKLQIYIRQCTASRHTVMCWTKKCFIGNTHTSLTGGKERGFASIITKVNSSWI